MYLLRAFEDDFSTEGLSSDTRHELVVPLGKLRLRFPIDPNDKNDLEISKDDRFFLKSSDGKYKSKKTIADDQIKNNRCLDLEFTGLYRNGVYTLVVERPAENQDGEDYILYTVFANMPYRELKAYGDALLQSAHAIDIELKDADGNPVAGQACVVHFHDGSPSYPCKTNSQGRIRLKTAREATFDLELIPMAIHVDPKDEKNEQDDPSPQDDESAIQEFMGKVREAMGDVPQAAKDSLGDIAAHVQGALPLALPALKAQLVRNIYELIEDPETVGKKMLEDIAKDVLRIDELKDKLKERAIGLWPEGGADDMLGSAKGRLTDLAGRVGDTSGIENGVLGKIADRIQDALGTMGTAAKASVMADITDLIKDPQGVFEGAWEDATDAVIRSEAKKLALGDKLADLINGAAPLVGAGPLGEAAKFLLDNAAKTGKATLNSLARQIPEFIDDPDLLTGAAAVAAAKNVLKRYGVNEEIRKEILDMIKDPTLIRDDALSIGVALILSKMPGFDPEAQETTVCGFPKKVKDPKALDDVTAIYAGCDALEEHGIKVTEKDLANVKCFFTLA